MNSTKPYLIRAFYNWITDNKCTPYIVVNAHYTGANVPLEYVDNGQIVLNVAKSAVQNLDLSNEYISFQASFNKIPQEVYFPVAAVMAIYAKENGRGMVFAEEEGSAAAMGKVSQNSNSNHQEDKIKQIKNTNKKKGHLSLVTSYPPEQDE
jgi:stringent starvation protein B